MINIMYYTIVSIVILFYGNIGFINAVFTVEAYHTLENKSKARYSNTETHVTILQLCTCRGHENI